MYAVRMGGASVLSSWTMLTDMNDGGAHSDGEEKISKGWNAPLHFHRRTLHAQTSPGTDYADDARHRRTGRRRHHLCDAVQAVTVRIR